MSVKATGKEETEEVADKMRGSRDGPISCYLLLWLYAPELARWLARR